MNLKPKRIGIIGDRGKCGQFFTRFFAEWGIETVGSDIGSALTNRQVVERSDVVIFAVSLGRTARAIKSVTRYSRRSQLWIDFASVKGRSILAMRSSRASVAGMHFMCSPPSRDFAGQNLIVTFDRVDPAWYKWLLEFCIKSKAQVNYASAEEHDRHSAFTQSLQHALALTMVRTVMKNKLSVKDLNCYGTPFYRVSMALAGRYLSHDPELVADLALENRAVVSRMLKSAAGEMLELSKIIQANKRPTLLKLIGEAKTHIGESEVERLNEVFVKISGGT